MIWIDSSFAIEWLLGTKRAAAVTLPRESLMMLPMQYLESFTYFLKHGADPIQVHNQLAGFNRTEATTAELEQAAFLYLAAREHSSKASFADALLAAVAGSHHGLIASFDHDLKSLGCEFKNGLWKPRGSN